MLVRKHLTAFIIEVLDLGGVIIFKSGKHELIVGQISKCPIIFLNRLTGQKYRHYLCIFPMEELAIKKKTTKKKLLHPEPLK